MKNIDPSAPSRRPRAYWGFIGLGVLALASCGGGDLSRPTQGLSQEQVRSARFLEREAVFDLRLRDDVRSSAAVAEPFRLGNGWFVAERSGRWAVGDRSALSAFVSDPRDLHLYIESQSTEAESVRVLVNGTEVGLMTPGPGWAPHQFELTSGVLQAGVNEIEFEFVFPANRPPFQTTPGDPATMIRQMIARRRPSTRNLENALPRIRQVFPGASLHGPDILNLPGIDVADVIGNLDDQGVGTGWQWVSVGGGSLSAGFRTIAFVEKPESFEPAARVAAFTRDRGELTIARSGRLFIPVEVPHPSDTLGFVASTPTGLGQSTEVRLSFESDRDRRALAEETLNGLWGTARYAAELDFDGSWGPGCLVVDVDVSPASQPVSIDVVEVIQGGDKATELPAPVPVSGPPDIVLVVLDAARADNFGCYGYERNTTPNVDALAAESLVFEHAYATSPYTACSMPTMFTGLSFRDHGVVGRNHSLDESITTLAESLQNGGYRTSCYSANPNNAVGRGTGQGCDLFEELWRGASPSDAIDPYRVSSSAIARLAEPFDQPEFLMLHYVPPHEPYLPAPGFDLFGDPTYTGDYDGSRDTVLGIDAGRLDPTPADMAEIVSLYDGNLLTGDDAFSQVLDVLKQRGRWDNTVVLVLSDHGEAFREHGKMSHNSTVYDEMLHIPFILRLPGGVVPEQIDTRGLVSLEDVVPTLLGLAGIEPTGPLSGVDLLASSVPRRRGVVARSDQDPPFLSYRTSRWKLITGRGVNELYDLEADPAESDNILESVASESIQTATCLQSLLEVELTRAPLGRAASEGVELSEDDVNTLRSLGYIR